MLLGAHIAPDWANGSPSKTGPASLFGSEYSRAFCLALYLLIWCWSWLLRGTQCHHWKLTLETKVQVSTVRMAAEMSSLQDIWVESLRDICFLKTDTFLSLTKMKGCCPSHSMVILKLMYKCMHLFSLSYNVHRIFSDESEVWRYITNHSGLI